MLLARNESLIKNDLNIDKIEWSAMDAEVLDLIVRSRPTILEILSDRGYNVDAYKGISPEEIFRLAVSTQNLLRINAPKKEKSDAPMEKAVVIYWVEGNYRLKLETEIGKILDKTSPDPEKINPEKEELIILLSEPFHDNFQAAAVRAWGAHKARVSFFPLKNLITNPSKHMFVPPHRKLTEEERDAVVKSLHMKSRFEFPHIKFHADIQARVLGLIHGDVVEIRRPSETCGEYVYYRVCTL
jgi:DNA-directed RNA polymerase subunit H (RpoH/RPB5)